MNNIDKILLSIVVVVDTREKNNKHILDWFDEKEIKYIKQKLDYADYSFYIPKNEILGIMEDTYFMDKISIERKANLDELAMNITRHRERFKRELKRHKGYLTLMIEDSKYNDIYERKYRSKINVKSYIGTLHSFFSRYNVPFIFMDKKYSAKYIYFTFYYYLKNSLNK